MYFEKLLLTSLICPADTKACQFVRFKYLLSSHACNPQVVMFVLKKKKNLVTQDAAIYQPIVTIVTSNVAESRHRSRKC